MEMKNIIFDTDIGGDCDDVTALDMLIAAHKKGDCNLAAVTYSSLNRDASKCIYAILKEHGMENVPIGVREIPDGCAGLDNYYASLLAESFYEKNAPVYEDTQRAYKLMRKTLAQSDKCVIAATGFLSNLAALLDSAPDEYSPLSGKELVKSKVEYFAVMCGDFRHTGLYPEREVKPTAEYNIMKDVTAAKYFFDNCPVPVYCLPFETGVDMISGVPITSSKNTPEALAFKRYGEIIKRADFFGRDSWDPATVLFALYGVQDNFILSEPVTVRVNADAMTDIDKGGNVRIISCKAPKPEIGKRIDNIISEIF